MNISEESTLKSLVLDSREDRREKTLHDVLNYVEDLLDEYKAYGNEDGYEEGFTAGTENGYEDGYAIGHADGYEEGYSTGHEDAYEAGVMDARYGPEE
jgi:flagellar biosynthesis/type III secretory pathway protein FliH